MGNRVGRRAAVTGDAHHHLLAGRVGAPADSVFPLEEHAMVSMMTAGSQLALTGTATLNLFAASSVAPLLPTGMVRAIIRLSPYTFAPIGILGIVLAAAVQSPSRSAGLMGAASGVLLAELLYTVLFGGFAVGATSMSVVELDGQHLPTLVWGSFWTTEVTTSIVICSVMSLAVLATWSIIFPYPKFLRFWLPAREGQAKLNAQAALEKAKEAAKVARKAATDAEEAAVAAESDLQAAQVFLNKTIAAEEEAKDRAGTAEDFASEALNHALAAQQSSFAAAGHATSAKVASVTAKKHRDTAGVAALEAAAAQEQLDAGAQGR